MRTRPSDAGALLLSNLWRSGRVATCWCVIGAVCCGLGPAKSTRGDDTPKLDPYGDPLPEGAVARLGTIRHAASLGAGRVEFVGRDQLLLSVTILGFTWVDAESGLIVRQRPMDLGRAKLLAVNPDRNLAAVWIDRVIDESKREHRSYINIVSALTGTTHAIVDHVASSSRDQIAAAEFTRDGRSLLTCDNEGVLQRWSVATGLREQTAKVALPSFPSAMSISPDGQSVVVTAGKEVFAWRWRMDEPPGKLCHLDKLVRSVEHSPDGSILAVASSEGGWIDLRSPETGEEIRRLIIPNDDSCGEQVAFIADGAKLLVPTGSRNIAPEDRPPGAVHLFNSKTGELEQTWGFSKPLRRVAVSPDGRFVCAAENIGAIAVWDLASGASLNDGQTQTIDMRGGDIAVTPDGAEAVTSGRSGGAVVWDLQSGQLRHVLPHVPGRWVNRPAVSADGKLIATLGFDDKLCVWSRETGELICDLPGHGLVGRKQSVAFSADSRRVISFGNDWFLRVTDVATSKAVAEFPIRPTGSRLQEQLDGSAKLDQEADMFWERFHAFTPDGETLVLGTTKALHLFDVGTGADRSVHRVPGGFYEFAVSADSRLIAVPTSKPLPPPREKERRAVVEIRDLESGQLKQSIPTDHDFMFGVAFSSDAQLLGVSGQTIEVFDVNSGRLLAQIEPDPLAHYSLRFTPDDGRLVVIDYDSKWIVWDWRHFLVEEEDRP